MRALPILLLGVAFPGIATAQTSASYKLTESTLNNGGDPRDGAYAASAGFHLKLDAIGDAALGVGLASAGWHMDAGFVDAYRPPGEIAGVLWPSKTTLQWTPEGSVGDYEVYRDAVSTLPGSYGSCFASSLTNESATEASSPVAGTGWFYLVTARNRLLEEGTKGNRTGGVERPNPSPCP